MKAQVAMHVARGIAAIVLLGIPLALQANDEPDGALNVPGYRPDSEYSAVFIDEIETMTIAVLPTMIRHVEKTSHSSDSQQAIIELLNESGISAVPWNRQIDLGQAMQNSQWQFFENGLSAVSDVVKGYDSGTDYVMVIELLTPDDQSIFGIEIYIVDLDGRNAFSFLLNDHHQLFNDANLVAADTSEEARGAMIESATVLAVHALNQQIRLWTEPPPANE